MNQRTRDARGDGRVDGTVVLVSRAFDAPADGAALAAKSLARAYAEQGLRVRVLCELGEVPRPGVEWAGSMCVVRLAPPHESAAGFAVRAAQHACELAGGGDVLAVECVDEPACVIAMRAAMVAGAISARLVSVVTRDRMDDELCATACRLADETHVFRPLRAHDDRARTRQVLLPFVEGVWKPPSGVGRAFVMPSAAAGATHRMVADAFATSGLLRSGWAVVAIGPTGRWMVSARGDDDDASDKRRADEGDRHDAADAVIIAVGDDGRDPVAARLAMAAGCRAVVSDASVLAWALPESLRDAAMYREGDAHSLALAMRRAAEGDPTGAWSTAAAQLRSAASAERVVRERAAWWSAAGRGVDRRAVRAAWHEAERALAACGADAEVGR